MAKALRADLDERDIEGAMVAVSKMPKVTTAITIKSPAGRTVDVQLQSQNPSGANSCWFLKLGCASSFLKANGL